MIDDQSDEKPDETASQASAGNLPKAYDPSEIEQRWAEYWVSERLFDVPSPALPSTRDAAKPFTMLLPPPNVTGYLHMGHMFEHTESDIVLRWHRMRGGQTVWVPGTDHAGIATQMLVERQLKAEGSSRQQMGREAFTARVWEWKRQYGNAITDQMRRLGASVDWSREYFTMDDRLSLAVKEAFVRLYEQGLIYRGAYIVNWDPQIQTAVSDLEVTHEERLGKLYHIRYPFADGTGSIVIATTRPETLLGDTAVAVNPADERYREFIGKLVTLPLTAAAGKPDREIPILADDWAQPEFGTGAVKVTPAHDPNDFAIGQRHKLASLTILDQTAHIDLPGSPYHGLDRFAARERIVADLEAAGLLVEVRDHNMAIAVSQRTGAVIEPRLSMQWFIAVNKPVSDTRTSIAQTAIDAVKQGHIKFTPEMYEKTYMEWMTNIHDWCISRQLWWGHRIPAWHCAACSAITVAHDTPPACATCGSAHIVQETDVLDTWFSSGLLPFTVFGWPGDGSGKCTPDLAAFYPTSLLVTGFDILFFWVARMIMLGAHFMLDVPMPNGSPRPLAEAVPFKSAYIHALVRDANREKMSKTKGNVVDPIEIIERFGTDAVRFTLASMASPGTDIAFSEARTEGYRAFANKIWNAARFTFMQLKSSPGIGVFKSDGSKPLIQQLPDETPIETRWMFSRLSAVAAEVDRALAQYRFDEAANAIYQFFWGEFCDWYLELIKLRLDFTDTETQNLPGLITLGSLLTIFGAALRLLSPFMPFITEEIWQSYPDLFAALGGGGAGIRSIALAHFPRAADFPTDAKAESEVALLQELITTVRAIRKELAVPEKEAAPIQIHAAAEVAALAQTHSDILARTCRVSAVEIAPSALTGNNARSTPSFDVAVIYARQIDVVAERERLTRDLAKYEKGLVSAERQLSNEAFMAKAPAHIVDGLRKQAAETRVLYNKAKDALDGLPPES